MTTYLEIMLIGLLGSMHCIGMCGGFVAMYSLKKTDPRMSLVNHVLYNLGRITTYALLGGLLGSLGSFAAYAGELRGIPGAVLLIAGMLMVLMGLNLSGILGKGGLFELDDAAGSNLFRAVFRNIVALDSAWGIFLLGLLLGFLPCGLLYPVLMIAASGNDPVSGMLLMIVFGLSTVPALLSFGVLMTHVSSRVRNILFRSAGVIVVLIGIRTVLRGMAFNGWISHARFW